MSPHSDTLSWFRANQSLLCLLNAAKKQHIPIIIFGFTWSGLDPTFYHTLGSWIWHYKICYLTNKDNAWMFFAIIKKKKHFRNSHYIVCYMAAIIKFVLIIIFFYQFSPELIMPLLHKIPHFFILWPRGRSHFYSNILS